MKHVNSKKCCKKSFDKAFWGKWGDVAQEVELSSGSRRVAGSIPPWACRSVPEQDT